MFCLLAIMVFLGPRAGILFWYLVDPFRWQHAFHNFNTFIAPQAASYEGPSLRSTECFEHRPFDTRRHGNRVGG